MVQHQPRKKIRFALMVCLLLFARGCDFYSTSLWYFQPDGYQDERNPLSYLLGIGWSGLVLVNIVMVLVIIGLFAYYTFRYKPTLPGRDLPSSPYEYASLLYYGRTDRFYQIFYRWPSNRNVLWAHAGYVVIRLLIVTSFLACLHNLAQWKEWSGYGVIRSIGIRPYFVFFGLVLAAIIIIYRNLLNREFRFFVLQDG